MSATVTAKPPLAPNLDLQPGDILLHLIVTLLAPMFLAVCCGNLDFARMAVLETVNAYRARGHVDLIAVAQIVAHGLASVSSACLSMSDDISLPMTLRLRASANASDRACERNRRALEKNRATPRPDPVFAPDPEPEPAADPTPDPEADRNDAEVSARLAVVRRQAEPPRTPQAPHRPADPPTPAAPATAAPATAAPATAAPATAAIAGQASAGAAASSAATPTPAAPTPANATLATATPAAPTPNTATPATAAPHQRTPHRTPPAPTNAEPTNAEPIDAEPTAQQFQQLWGAAMTVVANEYAASMADLPPAEREAARARAAVLNRAAGDLYAGNVPPRLRAGDLGTSTAT